MRKWECIVCGWVYDEKLGLPDHGVPPGTKWEDVPADFLCPDCGVGKEDFELIEDSSSTAEAEDSTEPKEPVKPVIVIGTGLAGYNLAKEFRKHDTSTPMILVTSDDGRFYSKPMLSTGFTRNTDADALATATAEEMEQQLSIEVKTFTTIKAIDTEVRRVTTDKGMYLYYSSLVLAWGAEVIEPPLTGDGLDRVFAVNSLMDYARFRQELAEHKVNKLLVIGAGLIGSEFANDLGNGGYQIEAVDPLPYTLPTLLPEQAGKAVQGALEEMGVRYHFGQLVKSIDKGPDGKGVVATLDNGDTVSADLVLSAVGVRPRVELARQAGIEVNRGIVVDRQLRTSASDVYALGDCAEVEGLVLFYVAPLMACARSLGKTLAGNVSEVAYPGMPVTIKTPICPVVVSPPPRDAEGEWEISGEERDVVAEYRSPQGQLLGFALTGSGTKQKLNLQKQLPHLLD